MKRIFYFLSALPVYGLFGLFQLLPVDTASWFGGFLGRSLGPLLPVHHRARHNLKNIFPEKSDTELSQIIKGMWDNLGRVAGELPHLHKIVQNPKRLIIKNMNDAKMLCKDHPGLFFSAHLGNWEVAAPGTAVQVGIGMSLVYRKMNNPFVEWLVTHYRTKSAHTLAYYPKGTEGAKACLKTLRRNGVVSMLLDQKMNDGIQVNFMGHPAMTAPALAQFALKFNAPIVPCRVTRQKGAHFVLEYFPSLQLEKGQSVENLMLRLNDIMSGWITEHPEQWFWVHSRWPFSKKYKKS